MLIETPKRTYRILRVLKEELSLRMYLAVDRASGKREKDAPLWLMLEFLNPVLGREMMLYLTECGQRCFIRKKVVWAVFPYHEGRSFYEAARHAGTAQERVTLWEGLLARLFYENIPAYLRYEAAAPGNLVVDERFVVWVNYELHETDKLWDVLSPELYEASAAQEGVFPEPYEASSAQEGIFPEPHEASAARGGVFPKLHEASAAQEGVFPEPYEASAAQEGVFPEPHEASAAREGLFSELQKRLYESFCFLFAEDFVHVKKNEVRNAAAAYGERLRKGSFVSGPELCREFGGARVWFLERQEERGIQEKGIFFGVWETVFGHMEFFLKCGYFLLVLALWGFFFFLCTRSAEAPEQRTRITAIGTVEIDGQMNREPEETDGEPEETNGEPEETNREPEETSGEPEETDREPGETSGEGAGTDRQSAEE